jgi:hypothetical protein
MLLHSAQRGPYSCASICSKAGLPGQRGSPGPCKAPLFVRDAFVQHESSNLCAPGRREEHRDKVETLSICMHPTSSIVAASPSHEAPMISSSTLSSIPFTSSRLVDLLPVPQDGSKRCCFVCVPFSLRCDDTFNVKSWTASVGGSRKAQAEAGLCADFLLSRFYAWLGPLPVRFVDPFSCSLHPVSFCHGQLAMLRLCAELMQVCAGFSLIPMPNAWFYFRLPVYTTSYVAQSAVLPCARRFGHKRGSVRGYFPALLSMGKVSHCLRIMLPRPFYALYGGRTRTEVAPCGHLRKREE